MCYCVYPLYSMLVHICVLPKMYVSVSALNPAVTFICLHGRVCVCVCTLVCQIFTDHKAGNDEQMTFLRIINKTNHDWGFCLKKFNFCYQIYRNPKPIISGLEYFLNIVLHLPWFIILLYYCLQPWYMFSLFICLFNVICFYLMYMLYFYGVIYGVFNGIFYFRITINHRQMDC